MASPSRKLPTSRTSPPRARAPPPADERVPVLGRRDHGDSIGAGAGGAENPAGDLPPVRDEEPFHLLGLAQGAAQFFRPLLEDFRNASTRAAQAGGALEKNASSPLRPSGGHRACAIASAVKSMSSGPGRGWARLRSSFVRRCASGTAARKSRTTSWSAFSSSGGE